MPTILDTDHIRACLRLFVILMTFPVVFGALKMWSFAVAFVLLIFAVPTFLILLVFGTLAMGWHGVREGLVQTGGRRAATMAAAPVMGAAVVLLAWPTLALAGDVALLGKLAVDHRRYQAMIADAQRRVAAGERDRRTEPLGGIVHYVDAGPPVRVAFDPQGLLDNWSGIVFDPSGDVMQARGFDRATGRFAAPARVTKLFGGDLVSCRHLIGDYYRCSFT